MGYRDQPSPHLSMLGTENITYPPITESTPAIQLNPLRVRERTSSPFVKYPPETLASSYFERNSLEPHVTTAWHAS